MPDPGDPSPKDSGRSMEEFPCDTDEHVLQDAANILRRMGETFSTEEFARALKEGLCELCVTRFIGDHGRLMDAAQEFLKAMLETQDVELYDTGGEPPGWPVAGSPW